MKPALVLLAVPAVLCAAPGAAQAQGCTITRQAYQELRTQSTRDRVEAALGCRGEVVYEGRGLGGGRATTLAYPGRKPGTLARLTFENDRLTIKAENGLE